MVSLSSAEQRQKIGYLRRLLNLDDDLYYDMLAHYGAASSKDLTVNDAYILINTLRNDAKAAGVWKPKASFQKYKYNNLNDRKGMASAKQLRYIEAMWNDISKAKNNNEKSYALRAFIKRITGKDALNFLTSKDVSKVIEALKAMRGGK